ncbi:hypothetical protein [Nocardioides sp. TF02-7]|uniref:hypothetical protein n=1 Tax=Nocardioides sp. TF02-7 TaxID=2917724 RepID=UPI001F053771|nr:hypothetical protein [Nocardioides sp. TF02-7]UMG91537.1 hypothetical protein MF408_15660 [Nocardioides sp. TF02-7]
MASAGRWRSVDTRTLPVLVVAAWGALFLNVLSFAGNPTVVPIPAPVGQLITQGALPVALVLALVVNRRGVVRSSLFLVLYTMLAVVSLMVSLHNEFFAGSVFRATRLLGFVVVLWLLTPWFGRRDLLLLRCHRIVLWAVLGTVLLGALISPGSAFAFEGRLSGAIWPIPPTQVAHYGAVLLGVTALLWMCRLVSGRHALVTVGVCGAVLAATHTRTALTAVVVGLVLAGASLFVGHARVRRTYAWGTLAGVGVVTLFASQITTWATRGQSAQDLSQLTGRTKVWSAVFGLDRPWLDTLFGSGMSNQSFGGLPIDSNWVASYYDQGWFGIAVEVAALLTLLVLAIAHAPGPSRAVAIFLIVYAVVASFTETGLGSPSPTCSTSRSPPRCWRRRSPGGSP